jgi:hypothetical protein
MPASSGRTHEILVVTLPIREGKALTTFIAKYASRFMVSRLIPNSIAHIHVATAIWDASILTTSGGLQPKRIEKTH